MVVSVIYAIVMVGAFIAVPPNPDKITAPMDLVNGFRIMTIGTMTMFWIILGLTFGLLWERLKPNEKTEFKTA